MTKFLLTVLFGAAAVTASAAPCQLLSVTDESWEEKYVTTFEYDGEGRLTKVVDGNSVYTFDYSQLASKKFIMTRVDTYEWEPEPEITTTEMDLNDSNLVIKAVEIEDGEVDEDYYTFEYTDGYLTNYKQVRPDEVEETKITYTDGRITKVENLEEDNESENETITFEYTDIMNPGQLVMLDNLFDINLDDIEYVAMTGMLGKIYTELPVKVTNTSMYGSESKDIKWTVDAEGYATKVEIMDDGYSEIYSFQWSGSTGIGTVNADNCGTSQFFSIDGKRVAADAKGIVIERRFDGSTVKRINR